MTKAGRQLSPGHIGVCPDCGKRRYTSRRDAKRMAKRVHPGAHMSVYACGEFWHIGNLDPRYATDEWRSRR